MSDCYGRRCRLRLLAFAAVRAAEHEHGELAEAAIKRGAPRGKVPTWAQLTASQKIDRVYRRVLKVTGQTDPRDDEGK